MLPHLLYFSTPPSLLLAKTRQTSVLSTPRGSPVPRDPSLMAHHRPEACNQGQAMQHDCITAWKLQLRLASLLEWPRGAACPRGQRKGTESKCLLSEGEDWGAVSGSRPAGAWAAELSAVLSETQHVHSGVCGRNPAPHPPAWPRACQPGFRKDKTAQDSWV